VAPKLMTIYGIAALALCAVDVIVSVALFPEELRPLFDDLVGPRIGLTILAVPWPIVALALINQRRARAACSN
jgi:hypothetical protein